MNFFSKDRSAPVPDECEALREALARVGEEIAKNDALAAEPDRIAREHEAALRAWAANPVGALPEFDSTRYLDARAKAATAPVRIAALRAAAHALGERLYQIESFAGTRWPTMAPAPKTGGQPMTVAERERGAA
jgi:hypothetical protein